MTKQLSTAQLTHYIALVSEKLGLDSKYFRSVGQDAKLKISCSYITREKTNFHKIVMDDIQYVVIIEYVHAHSLSYIQSLQPHVL